QIEQIANTFRSAEASRLVRERLDMASAVTPTVEKTPAEQGDSARIPLLCYRQGNLFDETALLDADWEITDFDPKLSESDFSHDVEAMKRASLTISQLETVACDVYDRL